MSASTLARAACLAAASLAFASPALADDEIVVVATRAPAPVERLPARIDVIDRSEMDSKALVTLADALREAPGAAVVSTGQPGAQTSLFLRGANSKHTLALYDGVRINDPTAPNGQYDFGQDLLGDLERVEIYRGAASSVYGSDAIGGVVNLVPRRGGERPAEPWFDLSGGGFSTWRAAAGVAGAVDALSYGVSLEGLRTDGFDQTPERFSTRTGERDGADLLTATATASYAIGGGASVDALVRHRSARADFDTFSGGPSGFQRADAPNLRIDRDAYTLWRIGAQRAGGGVTVRLDGGQVLNTRRERDGGVVTGDVEGRRDFIDLSLATESGSAGPLSDMALTAGLQWSREDIDNAATAFLNAVTADERNIGVYVTGRARVGPGADITASVRADDNQRFGGVTTWTAGVSQDLSRLGLSAGAPLRLHASYGTSFKAPSLSERFATSLFNVGNAALQPERGRSAEIGVDWTPLDGLKLGATAYETRVRSLIDYDFATLRNINIDRARLRGWDADIDAVVGARASLRASYAFTDARDISAPGAPRLARRAPHAWSIDARLAATDRLNLALGWSWISSRVDVLYDNSGFFAAGAGRAPGYDVGRLALTWALTGRLDAYAAVNNLADTAYEDPNAFRGAPRAATLGLRGRF